LIALYEMCIWVIWFKERRAAGGGDGDVGPGA